MFASASSVSHRSLIERRSAVTRTSHSYLHPFGDINPDLQKAGFACQQCFNLCLTFGEFELCPPPERADPSQIYFTCKRLGYNQVFSGISTYIAIDETETLSSRRGFEAKLPMEIVQAKDHGSAHPFMALEFGCQLQDTAKNIQWCFLLREHDTGNIIQIHDPKSDHHHNGFSFARISKEVIRRSTRHSTIERCIEGVEAEKEEPLEHATDETGQPLIIQPAVPVSYKIIEPSPFFEGFFKSRAKAISDLELESKTPEGERAEEPAAEESPARTGHAPTAL